LEKIHIKELHVWTPLSIVTKIKPTNEVGQRKRIEKRYFGDII